MTKDKRDEFIVRIAKAIWAAEVAAGNCSTSEPVTSEMKSALMRAASAAAAMMCDVPEWPGSKATSAFNAEVVELVKEKHGIDCSVVDRHPAFGFKWLDLSDHGYIGCVLLYRADDGRWQALVLPFNFKELMKNSVSWEFRRLAHDFIDRGRATGAILEKFFRNKLKVVGK